MLRRQGRLADRRGIGVILLVGGNAIPPHRKRLLAKRLGVAADSFASRELFFVTVAGDARVGEIGELLGARGRFAALDSAVNFVKVPRAGFVSPWSSKATDIVRLCGLGASGKNLRIERGVWFDFHGSPPIDFPQLCDPMTEVLLRPPALDEKCKQVLSSLAPPPPPPRADLIGKGMDALLRADARLSLGLDDGERDYLLRLFRAVKRNPSDAELLMFAQVNSEHCRHKIFRAQWGENGEPLFSKIRRTSQNPAGEGFLPGIRSAYNDNSAILDEDALDIFTPDDEGRYHRRRTKSYLIIKAETHNHPTAVSPFPGAATGSGGEIRDQAATGRGAESQMGFAGFIVSHLGVTGREWEQERAPPSPRAKSAAEIMIDGPLGAAWFNNEFGRPVLGGFFRAWEAQIGGVRYGYHKPVMLAAGCGVILDSNCEKKSILPGALIVQIGGPGMRIGVGGGSASSKAGGKMSAATDFASVQRDDAEMQRRAQEVVSHCANLADNPILSIHDVGSGGLANAVTELIRDGGCGARLDLADAPTADDAMSAAEIWCNESQERFVLAIQPESLDAFAKICERERCPFAVIGVADDSRRIVVADSRAQSQDDKPVDLALDSLFDSAPLPARDGERTPLAPPALDFAAMEIAAAARRVLAHPAVGDKRFLITIGDRSVGGLCARDQMVGPWQTPAADVAVSAAGFDTYRGYAMAAGERPAIALDAPAASARIAAAEALTNIAAADIGEIGKVKLSANWMADCGDADGRGGLRSAVCGLADSFCRDLGVAIPMGKDSLFMADKWRDENGRALEVKSPLTAVILSFAPVGDIRKTLTPQLAADRGDTVIIRIRPAGQTRMGGSILAQAYSQIGAGTPDISADEMRRLWDCVRALRAENLILAYHDISDGGMFAAVCEMAFAANCGATIALDAPCQPATDTDGGEHSPDAFAAAGKERMLRELFCEEIGVLLQIRDRDAARALRIIRAGGLETRAQTVARPRFGGERRIRIVCGGREIANESAAELRRLWGEAGRAISVLRDDPDCAAEEFDHDYDNDPGLFAKLSFDPAEDICAPFVHSARPAVAVLREQGTNGHREMAAAFDRAGFAVADVHLSDLESGARTLAGFCGAAFPGGFTFGDVLGAGRGMAAEILHNGKLREAFAAFFNRADTFALGVCNGCQTLARLGAILPNGDSFSFPRFLPNRSGRFEGRFVLAEIVQSPSLFFADMAGSVLPVVSAHGEGRVAFDGGRFDSGGGKAPAAPPAMRFVDNRGKPTERYPANPNGSPGGVCGFCSPDGRITIVMPHPERVFRAAQHSWRPKEWGEDGPWLRMFRNARKQIG